MAALSNARFCTASLHCTVLYWKHLSNETTQKQPTTPTMVYVMTDIPYDRTATLHKLLLIVRECGLHQLGQCNAFDAHMQLYMPVYHHCLAQYVTAAAAGAVLTRNAGCMHRLASEATSQRPAITA